MLNLQRLQKKLKMNSREKIDKNIWVAGAFGATNRTASISGYK